MCLARSEAAGVAQLAAQAQGNPFYLEELVNYLAGHRGATTWPHQAKRSNPTLSASPWGRLPMRRAYAAGQARTWDEAIAEALAFRAAPTPAPGSGSLRAE